MHLPRAAFAFALLSCAALSFEAADAAACILSASPTHAAVGISIITDASCSAGGLGCIDSTCRYCASTKTAQSSHLELCASFASAGHATAPIISEKAAVQESGAAACKSTVSDGDCNAGIRITTDPTCANGGVGCVDAICRYCQAMSTPNSGHFKVCTDIPGYVSSSCSQSVTPSAPASAPTPAPAPEPVQATAPSAIPSVCVASISKGDEDAGLAVVTDQTCSDRGTGCMGDVCRLCRRFDTPQSSAYKACSSIPAPPDLSDVTFKPIPVFGDLGEPITPEPLTLISVIESPSEQATPEQDVTTSESVVTTPSETGVTCSKVVPLGDCLAGLEIELDTDCLSGGKVGCIPQSACRFCKWKDTPQSSDYDDCVATTSNRAPTCALASRL